MAILSLPRSLSLLILSPAGELGGRSIGELTRRLVARAMASVYIPFQNSEEEREYSKQGKIEQFRQTLEEGSGSGYLFVAKGDLQQDSGFFKIVLDEDPNNIPALLGQGDFEKAGRYYMASVKEINRPQDFVLPFYGLGQVQLKLGDFRSSLSSFEKVLAVFPENCECMKAVGHIYVQLGQNEKALEIFRKAARIDPRDA
ncbi:uncharacterized protein A4U43_C06F7470 [Asparagus officinalis]|uniref:Uncharacterized protein n=1 Tax=Asparagus officinalis TaxID=4686 RepID=A0A5P1EKA4_ASPOF|nr:uncharacterized protein A4U43_C06F7470 [Asparagus officinalis]